MSLNPAAFSILAVLIVAGALAAVLLRDAVHAALALSGTLLAVAVLYLVIGGDAVAAGEVLVGTLALPAVLALGALATRGGGRVDRRPALLALPRHWPAALLAAVAVAAMLVATAAVSGDVWHHGTPAAAVFDQGTAGQFGATLLDRYALPLEIAGVVLLVVLVGGAVLARRDADEAAMERAAAERRLREERAQRRREERERARRERRGAAVATDDVGEG